LYLSISFVKLDAVKGEEVQVGCDHLGFIATQFSIQIVGDKEENVGFRGGR
jgi:hypothetical protein